MYGSATKPDWLNSNPGKPMSILDIRSAINAELEATPQYYDFKVERSERDGRLWRVSVQTSAAFAESEHARVVLDESFDGAAAWWAGPPKGAADVLAVIPEEDQLILRGATARPPDRDGFIRLYPPRYLQALADGWRDNEWAASALGALKDLACPSPVEANPLSGHAFRWLRRAQRRALRLVKHSSAYLWGPPGTGKTTTLGVILAEYLHVNPRARVLLLSTTNLAVDQATIAVDKALEQAGRSSLRQAVKRVGTRFTAGHYAGREHLLPVLDYELIARLAKAEGERPASTDVAAYSAWAERIEAIRAELKAKSLQVLRSARLASMTTTRAAFTLKDLRELARFDLVVFDEASQIGLAHALLLMPLGRSRLFAGDPQQLSPVVRSTARNVQRWLARSPFAEMPRKAPSVCLLDEQSRMAEPISELVSHLFYDGTLRVAADALQSAQWMRQRTLPLGGFGAGDHVCLAHIPEEGTWSQAYRGPIRFASASLIAGLLRDAIDRGHVQADAVIVLTPFRAQRALLRRQLAELGVRKVRVSTVHRAQGSEALVVIFDPAVGSNSFLQTEEARRLINVAISRAQGKLVLALSTGDLENPLLASIMHRQRLAADTRGAVPIESLLFREDFPACAIGCRVAISRHSGEVSRVSSDGKRLFMHNDQTGAEQEFDLEFLRQRTASAGP